MVKYSSCQLADAPSLRICRVMVEPECSFQRHTRSTNLSRPRSWRLLPCSSSWRSTTIWVAMPAWSVPTTQFVLSPRMRW
jgi:hypothetical protein